MLNSLNKNVTGMLLASLLSGCTSMAPTYVRPEMPVADRYPTADGKVLFDAVGLGWREFFPDQRLQVLIAAALKNNRDLRIAALNIEEARALYDITVADTQPNVNGDVNSTHSRTASNELDRGQAAVDNSYSVGLQMAAFELDFFGRVRSLKDAALASYLATEEARQSAQISLISQVAQTYLGEQSLSEQQQLALQTLNSRLDDYKLDKMRFDLGAASDLDLRNSESLVQSARESIAVLTRQRGQASNALMQLVGMPVGELPAPQSLLYKEIIIEIPAGLPSDLLNQRPDIRQAEQQLRSVNANIGAARAAFFPAISLTGGVGSSSSSLGSLFSAGSRTWSFMPQLTLPILDGGRNRANLSLSEIRKNIAIANYEIAIQVAFREVSDALVARATLDEQLAAQDAFVKAQEERVRLTDLRYKNGAANSTERLIAHRDRISALQSLIHARQLRQSNAIDLYRSLGGGLSRNTAPTPELR